MQLLNGNQFGVLRTSRTKILNFVPDLDVFPDYQQEAKVQSLKIISFSPQFQQLPAHHHDCILN